MTAANNHIARIENSFIFNAQYNLTAREQKLILYLISQINPQTQSEFQKQVVSIKDIETHLTNGKRRGSIYQEMKDLTRQISKRQIEFEGVEIDGVQLPGFVNWFGSITPMKDESGNLSIEFIFSEKLKPFLIDLEKYARISLSESLKLGSGIAIRLFQLFRAQRDKMAKHEKTSSLIYEIEELKKLLGLEGKYSDIRNFKKVVITRSIEQINSETSIKVLEPIFQKSGRSITGVKFKFQDSYKRNQKSNSLTIEELSFAENKSLDLLIDFGINSDIALSLISKIGSSEFRGFEDWYFGEALNLFLHKTNQTSKNAKAGTFVKWFLADFQTNNFASILEKVQERKKKLQKENLEAWNNRITARNITASEFRNLKL